MARIELALQRAPNPALLAGRPRHGHRAAQDRDRKCPAVTASEKGGWVALPARTYAELHGQVAGEPCLRVRQQLSWPSPAATAESGEVAHPTLQQGMA